MTSPLERLRAIAESDPDALAVAEAHGGKLSRCSTCGVETRPQRGPHVPGTKARHTRRECVTCYRRRTRYQPGKACQFENCTVCLRTFGTASGKYGGVVRLGLKRTGVCVTCRERLRLARKREREEDRTEQGNG